MNKKISSILFFTYEIQDMGYLQGECMNEWTKNGRWIYIFNKKKIPNPKMVW